MLNAQSPLANYSLLDMDNGLSSINLTSVCVDTNNFLWIASANGLQVYDGNTFYKIPYGLGKKNILGNKVQLLNKLNGKFILAGTDKGISKINTETFEIDNIQFNANKALAKATNRIQDIKIRKDYSFWVVTTTHVFLLSPELKILQSYAFPFWMQQKAIPFQPNRIIEFPNHKVWVIGPVTQVKNANEQCVIFEIDPKQHTIITIDSIPFKDYNRYLSIKQINEFSALVVYDSYCGQAEVIEFDLIHHNQTAILHKAFQYGDHVPFLSNVSNDEIGITTNNWDEYLIYNSTSGKLESIVLNPSLFIRQLVQHENYYFAATDRGLMITTPVNTLLNFNECSGIFKNWTIYPTSTFENDTALFQCYLYTGVSMYNKVRQSCSFYQPISPIDSQTEIHKIFLLDSNNWLVCGNQCFQFDPFKNKASLISKTTNEVHPFEKHASSVFLDSRNEFWFGTVYGNGIFRYNPRTKNVIHKDLKSIDSMAHFLTFNTIQEDSSGNIWFASALGNGLIKWTRKTDHYSLILPDNKPGTYFYPSISKMILDQSGYLWIGTEGGGIYRFHPDSMYFENFTQKIGLQDNFITSLTTDCLGKIWGSNLSYLFRYDPMNSSTYFFTKNHGIPSTEITVSRVNGQNCKLHLKGPRWNYYLEPESFQIPKPIPSLFIRTLKVNGNEIEYNKKLELDYDQNNLEIEFAHANLLDGNMEKYYYQISDKNKDWNFFGDKSTLRLVGIGYGSYHLSIRTCQNGNVCFDTSILHFKVNRPFWKSPLYYGLMAILVAGFFLFIIVYDYRLKISKIEKERDKEILRNKIAQDIHDEVGSSLTKIALTAQVASRIANLSQEDLKNRLTHVAKDAKIASSQLRELVFSINPDFDHFDDMQAYFQEYSRLYLEDSGIQLFFNLPKSNSHTLIHPDIKRQLLLIFKEILNNILKHSNAQQVWIQLEELDTKTYLFEIKDDGKGFDPKLAGKSSNGMRGLIQRTDSISATLKITSKLGTGTTIRVIGPLQFGNGHSA